MGDASLGHRVDRGQGLPAVRGAVRQGLGCLHEGFRSSCRQAVQRWLQGQEALVEVLVRAATMAVLWASAAIARGPLQEQSELNLSFCAFGLLQLIGGRYFLRSGTCCSFAREGGQCVGWKSSPIHKCL